MNINKRTLYFPFLRTLKAGMRLILLFLFFLLWSAKVDSQVVVRMQLDTVDILVGEQIQLKTFVSAGSQQIVKFPEFTSSQELVPGVEVISSSKIDTLSINQGKRMELQRNYVITSFDSALYTIPPMEVEVDGKKYKASQNIGLKVSWVPVDTLHVDQFPGPHSVVPQEFVWQNKLWLLTLPTWVTLVLILMIAVRLTVKKPLVKRKTIQPMIPPYRQASLALDDLHGKLQDVSLDTAGKDFYVQLTEIIRVYLERRFHFPAMEKTTSEIVDGVSDFLSKEQIRQMEEIFTMADVVKFAKYGSSTLDRERHLKMAVELLKETIDEKLENPTPEVQIVVLEEGMQLGFRRFLWISFFVLLVGSCLYSIYLLRVILDTYL